MFTGIIEEVGKILSVENYGGQKRLKVGAEIVTEGIKIGDSIAVNGVCTTATSVENNAFSFDLSSQTLKVTTFKNAKIGDFVNLERAVKVGERLSGHIVSGHVDFEGVFVLSKNEQNSVFLTFEVPEDKAKYFIDKGSVAINGISLTIAQKRGNQITVCVIPHTLENTTLKDLKANDNVNIEIDVIAKYVENFVGSNDNNSRISDTFLRENGFV